MKLLQCTSKLRRMPELMRAVISGKLVSVIGFLIKFLSYVPNTSEQNLILTLNLAVSLVCIKGALLSQTVFVCYSGYACNYCRFGH